MDKKPAVLTLILILALAFSLHAEEESFTITTYYPSPYGSYNELQVYRSVTYKPLNKDALANPKEGELVYDDSKDRLYLYNGSKWVAQGGETGAILTLIGDKDGGLPTCPSGWTSAQTGYWNCGYLASKSATAGGEFGAGGTSAASYAAAGSCFCAPSQSYSFGASATLIQNYSACIQGQAGTSCTRCNICIK